MAGLIFGGITPHGVALIPALSDDADGGIATRRALEELGRRCAAARPEVIVVATPHGTRVDGTICLAAGARGIGTLRWGDRQIGMDTRMDLALTDRIAAAARARGVPIAMASLAGNQREQSANVLDWAVTVPLWFLGFDQPQPGAGDLFSTVEDIPGRPTLVVAAPSRSLPRSAMVEFGTAIAEAAAAAGRRVALIASCDWAHTHSASGPYGFDPAAEEVDRLVVDAIGRGDLLGLIDLPEEKASAAAIDGLWQTLMLGGALQHTPMRGELLSYEAPTYFGMLVAAYQP